MVNCINEFFAASNGYDGFISYFDTVFSVDDYQKIYILKGGPGTGKSSFMRKSAERYENAGLLVQRIYCSSDPKSLDGVIISNGDLKIAIVDGTSPHTFEPTLPGAAQKIINLGTSWNESSLSANAEALKAMNKRKGYHYKSAYQFLSVAKRCAEIVDAEMQELLNFPINEIFNQIKDIPEGSGNEALRITTAFCKEGFFELLPISKSAKREINVVGIYGSEYTVMRKVYEEAKRRSLDITLSPSPLDKQKLDAILFNADGTAITVNKRSYTSSPLLIDTSRYVDTRKLNERKSKIETLYKERELMLWCATDEFKKASDAHFDMEKIYIAAMDFEKNVKIFKSLCREIDKIFKIKHTDTN